MNLYLIVNFKVTQLYGLVVCSSQQAQSPVYLTVIRDPVDRLISHYYYARYGSIKWKGQSKAKSNMVRTYIDVQGVAGG